MAIEWGALLLRLTMSKLADATLEALRGDPLARALTNAVEQWNAALPEGAKIAVPEAIFPSHLHDEDLEDRPKLRSLRECMARKRLPSADLWEGALLEHYERDRPEVESYGFFSLPAEDARSHLGVLACDLSQAVVDDRQFFQRWVHETLSADRRTTAGVLQLLPSEGGYRTEYTIPDGDDNRNLFCKEPDRWSYSVFRMTWVLEARSMLTIHGCRQFVRVDNDWREATPFHREQANWPFSGPATKHALTREALGVGESAHEVNALFQLMPDAAKKFSLRSWLMTQTSLDREGAYVVLVQWQVNTSRLLALCVLYETAPPILLSSKLTTEPDSTDLGWADTVIAKRPRLADARGLSLRAEF